MKEKELRTLTTCGICQQKVCATGLPLFWVVTVERHGLKVDAMRRQDGLAQMLNSPALAMVMGTDEEMTEPLMAPRRVAVCENCSHESHYLHEFVDEE